MRRRKTGREKEKTEEKEIIIRCGREEKRSHYDGHTVNSINNVCYHCRHNVCYCCLADSSYHLYKMKYSLTRSRIYVTVVVILTSISVVRRALEVDSNRSF